MQGSTQADAVTALRCMVKHVGYPLYNQHIVVSQVREVWSQHNLKPSIAPYVSPSSPSPNPVERLCLQGHLAITVRGRLAAIPIRVWILLNFPHDPPLIYVIPYKNLCIDPEHPKMRDDGRAYIEMLRMGGWRPSTDTLNRALFSLSQEFSERPPLVIDPRQQSLRNATDKLCDAFRRKELDAKAELSALQLQLQELELSRDNELPENNPVLKELIQTRQTRILLDERIEDYMGKSGADVTVDEFVAASFGKGDIQDAIDLLKASDYAISDALQLFARSCETGSAPVEDILSQTRKLATDQFMVRARLAKASALAAEASSL